MITRINNTIKTLKAFASVRARMRARVFAVCLILVLIVVQTFGFGFGAVFGPEKAEAVFNKQINYQGKLTNTSNVAVADGTYHMMFKLYTTATGGSPIWTEDRSTAAGDRATVTNGLFSILLGSSTPLTDVDFNQTLYLGVEIGGSSGSPSWDGEMTPRKKLGAVPAAFVADTIDNISSEQFLRADASNSTSTASSWLSFVQNGAGKIAEFFGPSSASVLSILSGGNVGVGTTTPYARLSVVGQVVGTYFTSTSTTVASTFPQASTTMLSVSGTAYMGTASTTALVVQNSANCSGSSALTTNSAGVVSCAALSGFATFSYPFTSATNYGVTNSATSTPLWAQAGINASSTSHFVYASTTALTVAGNAYFPGSGIWNSAGRVGIGSTTPDSILSAVTSGPNGGIYGRMGYSNPGGSGLYYAVAGTAGDLTEGFAGLGVYDDNTNLYYGVYSPDADSANYFAGTTTIGTLTDAAKLTVAAGSYTIEIGDTSDARGVHATDGGSNTASLVDSGSGAGVRGFGATYGVLGENNSPTGSALFALQNNSSGYAVYASGGQSYFQGRVGIGTSTPSYQTDIWATNSGAETIGLRLQNYAAGGSAGTAAGIGFTVSTADTLTAKIVNYIASSADRGLAFSTFNGTALTEKFRITGGGNVGIGTTSPYAALSVVGSSGVVADHYTATSTNTASAFPYASSTAISVSGTGYFGTASTTNLILSGVSGCSGSSALNTNSSGTVSCGAISGFATFSYPFTSATNYGVNTSATTTPLWAQAGIFASSTSHFANFDVVNSTTTGNAYFAGSGIWNSSGFVGIGTTSPMYSLHVASTTSATTGVHDVMAVEILTSGNPAVGFGPSILFKDAGANADHMARIAAVYEATSGGGGAKGGALSFYTNPSSSLGPANLTERMRISLDGNVGIGTTSPYSMLSVAGQVVAKNYIATSTTAASVFPYASTTALTVSGSAYFAGNGIWNSSGFLGVGTTSPWAQFSIHSNGIGSAPIFAIGSSTKTHMVVTNAGRVGIGTTSPAGTFAVQGDSPGLGAGGYIFLTAGRAGAFSASAGGVVITGGTGSDDGFSTDTAGGDVIITGGSTSGSFGGGTGGNVTINPGTGISGTDGNILLASIGGKVGIGTTSPYAKLSVVGQVVGAYFTATTTTASTFPQASTTLLTVSSVGYIATASTTNLTVQSAANCSGTSALTTNSAGVVSCGAISGGSAFPFTPATNYGVNTSATTTPLWAQAGIFASSTSHFANFDVVNSTTTGNAYFAGSGIWNSSGNIGLGTTSPASRLSFVESTASTGGISFGDDITVYRSSQNVLSVSGGDISVGSTYIQSNGTVYADNGLVNFSTLNNARIRASTTGVQLLRNVADSSPATYIQQQHAGSTGDILQLANSGGVVAQFTQAGKLGIGTTTPWATLSVVGGTADTVPVFAVATSTGKTPLLYITSTTTGNLDWARVAIGTTTNIGAAGLRDQFVVAGRIYSTWKELRCDMVGSSRTVSTTRQNGEFCGNFALDSTVALDGGFTFIANANPSYLTLRAGVTTNSAVGEAYALRTGTRSIAPENNPVMEASVRTPTIVAGTGSTSAYFVGFTSHTAQASTYHFDPSDGVYFAATSTANWRAIARTGGVETSFDTGVATSTTNFAKMRIELTPNLATFLVDNVVIGTISTNIPTGVNLSLVISVAVTNAPTTPAREIDISMVRLWVDDPPGGMVIENQNNFAALNAAPTPYDALTGANISTAYLAGDPTAYAEGEIVSIDPDGGMKVKKSDKKYDSFALGVIGNSAPAQILGNEDENTVRVAMQGRANVLVNNENGAIGVGDLITSSSVPGVGMKAIGSGYVLGRALSALSPEEASGTIIVDLNPHDYSGSVIVTDDEGNVGIGTLSPKATLDVMGNVRALGFEVQSDAHAVEQISALTTDTYNSYLEKIKNIRLSTFIYKNDTTQEARLGILASDAPAEVLSVSGGQVDVYKLAAFTLGGVKALEYKFTHLESRVSALEGLVWGIASTSASTTTINVSFSTLPEAFFAAVLERLSGLGANIMEGVAGFKKLVTETLTVGSPEKPTGITLYDDVTGTPHCLTISNGVVRGGVGECGKATDVGDAPASSGGDTHGGTASQPSAPTNPDSSEPTPEAGDKTTPEDIPTDTVSQGADSVPDVASGSEESSEVSSLSSSSSTSAPDSSSEPASEPAPASAPDSGESL